MKPTPILIAAALLCGFTHRIPCPATTTVDSSPAFEAALAAAVDGDILQLETCRYRMSRPLKLGPAIVRVIGVGAINGKNGPGLVFDPNMRGVEILQQGISLEHVAIYSKPDPTGAPRDPNAHGIWAPWKFNGEDIRVSRFPGDGIHFEAPVAAIPGSNANGFRLIGGLIDANRGNGIYARGADTNAGRAWGVNLELNEGWGVYDDSFLGSNWIALQAHANKLGSYYASGAGNNQTSLFVACYQEMDNDASINGRSGSFMMSTTTGSGAILQQEGGGFRSGHFRAMGDLSPPGPVGTAAVPQVFAMLGGSKDAALQFGEVNKQPFLVGRRLETAMAGMWTLHSSGAPSKPSLGFSGPGARDPLGSIHTPLRYLIGIPGVVSEGYGTSPPTTQDSAWPWVAGSVFVALHPAAGGVERWRLTSVNATSGALTWKVASKLEP